MLRTLLEWKPLVTFLGGVVVGGLLVAGVQRREPAAVSSVSVGQQQAQRLVDKQSDVSPWTGFVEVEKRVPKHLEKCVSLNYAGEMRREQDDHARRLTFALERAVGACVAMEKKPAVVAKK